MTTNFRPAQTGFSRVFLIEGRARPGQKPVFQSNMKAGAIAQSFGDITKIEVPSPYEFGKFIEVGTIRGATDRVTITLTGRYAADLRSQLLKLATRNCSFDIHINFGVCTDPSDYNVFTKKIVLEDAFVTNYSTEDIGALGSDEQAKVDESIDVSAKMVYELMPLTFAARAGDVVTNEVVDVTYAGVPSCGDCDEESDGCQIIFAVTLGAGGSPTTPADVVFSLDGGVTFMAHDVDSALAAENPNAIGVLGRYVFVTVESVASLHYALVSEFNAYTDPEFTQVTTGFVTGAGPRAVAVARSKAFIAGAGGYIYVTEDPSTGVTVADASTAHPLGVYNAIDALSDSFAVAVGNGGIIAKTENGLTFSAVASPVGVGVNLTAVAVKSESTWLIGTSTGLLYLTENGGVTWSLKAFPGDGSGVVQDIAIATDSELFLSHTTIDTHGRILRSTNGGYDWVVMPEGVGSIPLNDRVTALAACNHEPNTVVGVGLADDGTDGYIVVGN